MHYVNDINLVPKMGQIIKVQRPVSSASISGLYVILEAAFILVHDRSLSWLGTDTSIKSGRVKLVFWAQTSPLSEMMQIIKVQRPVSSASISGLYVILEAAFTIALLGLLLHK
jgi:hypothetical protein